MSGIFTISLDFELHWGGVEKWSLTPASNYPEYFRNTRKIIPQVLESFSAYGINATWATIGLLFNRDRAGLMASLPVIEPGYENKDLSAYRYIRETTIGENEQSDPFHYGHELILSIKATPGQEIGSHTFSHYYCNEAGQTADQFAADLAAAV
ncbi:MAG: polysaccharide deacetylase, partial [Bacteroidota bacterium]